MGALVVAFCASVTDSLVAVGGGAITGAEDVFAVAFGGAGVLVDDCKRIRTPHGDATTFEASMEDPHGAAASSASVSPTAAVTISVGVRHV